MIYNYLWNLFSNLFCGVGLEKIGV